MPRPAPPPFSGTVIGDEMTITKSFFNDSGLPLDESNSTITIVPVGGVSNTIRPEQPRMQTNLGDLSGTGNKA